MDSQRKHFRKDKEKQTESFRTGLSGQSVVPIQAIPSRKSLKDGKYLIITKLKFLHIRSVPIPIVF